MNDTKLMQEFIRIAHARYYVCPQNYATSFFDYANLLRIFISHPRFNFSNGTSSSVF